MIKFNKICSGIYKIINIKNKKFYIGSSKDMQARMKKHKYNLNSNRHINRKLQNAWNKYGKTNFKFEILEIVKPEKLFDRENYYLNTLKPYKRQNGYNISINAEGIDTFTYNPRKEQIRKKMSILQSGKNNTMYGKKHSPETIKIQKLKAKGRYTLDWFISRHGKTNGGKKYKTRCDSLKKNFKPG